MSNLTARQRLLDEGYEDVIIFGSGNGDGYDDALIGVDTDNRAVYDYDMMVDWLMRTDGMTDIDAIEWIEYNTVRSLPYVGDGAPIIIHKLENNEVTL